MPTRMCPMPTIHTGIEEGAAGFLSHDEAAAAVREANAPFLDQAGEPHRADPGERGRRDEPPAGPASCAAIPQRRTGRLGAIP